MYFLTSHTTPVTVGCYGKYNEKLMGPISECCCGILELNLLHHIGSILDILKFLQVMMKVVTTYRVDVQRATPTVH